jgi:hypothetical protein
VTPVPAHLSVSTSAMATWRRLSSAAAHSTAGALAARGGGGVAALRPPPPTHTARACGGVATQLPRSVTRGGRSSPPTICKGGVVGLHLVERKVIGQRGRVLAAAGHDDHAGGRALDQRRLQRQGQGQCAQGVGSKSEVQAFRRGGLWADLRSAAAPGGGVGGVGACTAGRVCGARQRPARHRGRHGAARDRAAGTERRVTGRQARGAGGAGRQAGCGVGVRWGRPPWRPHC